LAGILPLAYIYFSGSPGFIASTGLGRFHRLLDEFVQFPVVDLNPVF